MISLFLADFGLLSGWETLTGLDVGLIPPKLIWMVVGVLLLIYSAFAFTPTLLIYGLGAMFADMPGKLGWTYVGCWVGGLALGIPLLYFSSLESLLWNPKIYLITLFLTTAIGMLLGGIIGFRIFTRK